MLTSLVQTKKQIVAASSTSNETLYTVPEGKTFVGYILASGGGTWYGYNMIPAGAVASNSNFIAINNTNLITLASGTIIKTAAGTYGAATLIMGIES